MANENNDSYQISDIYQGGYSSLKAPSEYGNSDQGYVKAGSLSVTTDPRTANVLKEVSSKLSAGIKNIEVTSVSPEVFDSIPDNQLKEVHRLSKLTGVDVSMHAPVVDSAGISQQGFSEADRELAERKITNALVRAKELNPDGNIPVTFHSAEGIPSSQLLPPKQREDGKKYEKLVAVNRDTGKITAVLEPEEQYHVGDIELKPDAYTPERRLQSINRTEWENSVSQLIFNKDRVSDLLERYRPLIEHLEDDIASGKIGEGVLHPSQERAAKHFLDARTYLRDLHQQLNSLFDKAYKYSDEEQRAVLKGFSDKFGDQLKEGGNSLFSQSQAMHDLLHNLERVVPEVYEPIEKFAAEKSSETFGNSAFNAYKEFKGKNVPMMVIENPPAGIALSTGEDIKNLVEKSREQFVKKAVEEGMDKSKAWKEAEKLIGATWDVGHINMLRKFGYQKDDIVEETKTAAPYVKHIHFSDNFGLEHTELPMGMGNVPLKEMMERLGEEGFEAKKVIEASSWWQHWQTHPFEETLRGLGSPIYSMKMAPYWNQSEGLYQSYFSGMEGAWLPQINYETFGSGFSRLPSSLGGSAPGAAGSRMSGRGME